MQDFEFDFEKLKVYQKSLDLIERLVMLMKQIPKEFRYSIGDNLIRAAFSVANNIAEGNDKTSPKEKSRYLNTSKDSARECASVVIALNRLKFISISEAIELKGLVREITSMIKGLLKSLNTLLLFWLLVTGNWLL